MYFSKNEGKKKKVMSRSVGLAVHTGCERLWGLTSLLIHLPCKRLLQLGWFLKRWKHKWDISLRHGQSTSFLSWRSTKCEGLLFHTFRDLYFPSKTLKGKKLKSMKVAFSLKTRLICSMFSHLFKTLAKILLFSLVLAFQEERGKLSLKSAAFRWPSFFWAL